QPPMNCTLDWYERPDLLCYTTGGLYKTHADAENYNSVSKMWEKVLDRDLSLLLYLNNDFSGGNLVFTKFNYHYQPQKGDLLVFPSDHRYEHRAEQVTAGTRYAVVSWAAIKDGERVNYRLPNNAIMMNDASS
ncbi:MAG: 2OG-Fe(II) oxygenase, partial [Pseudomonadales bacterium]